MRQLATRVPSWIAMASAVLFILLGAENIRLPGLQYDESLFVNAALGGITDAFIHGRIMGIPVMLMPYIGALKPYLFAPVFALFGVSLETIRLPALALSAVSILLGYRLGCLATGSRWLGAILSLLMATDPIFIFLSRTDFGPIALMTLLKLTALVAMYRLLESSQVRFAWMLTASMLLGVFDKLNFIWIVNAVAVAGVMVYHRELVRLARKSRATWWAPAGTLVAGLAVFGVVLIAPLLSNGGPTTAMDWETRSHYVAGLYRSTLSARAINEMMLGDATMPSSPGYVCAAIALAGVVLLLVVSTLVPRLGPILPEGSADRIVLERRKSLVFFVALFALILAQLIITPEATGPHHVMTLWPLHYVILLLVLATAGDYCVHWLKPGHRFARPRAILAVPCLVVVLPMVAAQVRVARTYDRAFVAAKSLPAIWTKAIYPLAGYVSRSNSSDLTTVVCVDWGICNQIFALSPEVRSKTKDLWPAFQTLQGDADSQVLFDGFFRAKHTMVLVRTGTGQIMDKTYSNFRGFAARYLGDPSPTMTVTDGNGLPVFEVFELEAQ